MGQDMSHMTEEFQQYMEHSGIQIPPGYVPSNFPGAKDLFMQCMEGDVYSVCNPSGPLPFERYGPGNNTAHLEDSYDGLSEEIAKIHEKNKGGYTVFDAEKKQAKEAFKSARIIRPGLDTHRAFIAALEAYGAPDPVTAADKALELFDIPEAYNVKAMFQSKDYKEAQQFYQQAADAALRLEEKYKVHKTNPKLFGQYHKRSFMRAINGQANCLRKTGKYAEAEILYKQLQALDSDDTIAGVDWQFYILEVLMKQGKFTEADKLARSKSFMANMERSLTFRMMGWTMALLDYICHGKRGFDEEFSRLDEPDIYRDMYEEQPSIAQSVMHMAHVLKYLTGKVNLPDAPLLKQIGLHSSWTLAAEYARAYLPLWQNTPGAIEWAKKNYNTFQVINMTMPQVENYSGFVTNYLGVTNDEKTFKKFVMDGIYIDLKAPEIFEHNQSLLHHVLEGNYKRAEILLEAGASVSSEGPNEVDPLEWVVIKDYNPRNARALIKYGCDPYHHQRLRYLEVGNKPVYSKFSTAERAALLAHARHLHAICRVTPPNAGTCEELLMVLASSEFGRCLNKAGTCKNCMEKKRDTHSPNASVKYTVMAILLTGYRPSEEKVLSFRDNYCDCEKNCKSCIYGKSFHKMLKSMMKLEKEEMLKDFEQKYGRVLPYCAVCKSLENLRKCGFCRAIHYCGSKCQKKDWKTHTLTCSKK